MCEAIWSLVAPIVIPEISEQNWLITAENFQKNANFPHCIGAIDGKHIRIVAPPNSGSMFYNYKNYFSTVLFAMCDSNYLFTYIDVGSYGKSSDSGIFKNSTLYKNLINNSLSIPEPSIIGETSDSFPYVILGDEGFPLYENLLRPYGGKNLSDEKKIFNYRLSRARRYIECSFGILANKWRILHRPLNMDIDLSEKIIRATCVLHNYVRQRDGANNETIDLSCPMPNLSQDGRSRGNSVSINTREKFAKYFVTVDPLEWQNKYI